MWKDKLHRISRLEFYEWLFGPEKLSGLSRNGPLAPDVQSLDSAILRLNHYSADTFYKLLLSYPV